MRIAARLFPRAFVSAGGFSSPFLSRQHSYYYDKRNRIGLRRKTRSLFLSLSFFSEYIHGIYRHLTIYVHACTYARIRERKKKSRLSVSLLKAAMTHTRGLRFYETSDVLCVEFNRWNNVTKCQNDLRTATIPFLNF